MTRSRAAADRDALVVEQFAVDVRYYLSLTPRQLPSRYFYDEVGSALFETICRLPWYPITRAEMHLLEAHSGEILDMLPSLSTIVELGSGSGDKLRMLLAAGGARGDAVEVHLVDVSPSALTFAAQTVATAGDFHIVTHRATYDAGLRDAAAAAHGRTLVAFLGSNIGNFDAPGSAAFLQNVHAAIMPGDALLVGVDLVKPKEQLLPAYDDPLGVTAAFNKNLLLRINRELGGDIDLHAFAHRAVWNDAASRVEMHLVARSAQRLRIPRADVDIRLQPREFIWTESSYKYIPSDVNALLQSCGFRPTAQWIEREEGFALTLAEAF